MDLETKLTERLENILYHKRMELGLLLEWYEIEDFIKQLRKRDPETYFFMDSFLNSIKDQFCDDYLKAEKQFKKLLNYYGLFGKKDILNCRHQLFFTDNKKVTKKPFFDKKQINDLKTKYKNVFDKLEASDEI